jgi:hypothetical protein
MEPALELKITRLVARLVLGARLLLVCGEAVLVLISG